MNISPKGRDPRPWKNIWGIFSYTFCILCLWRQSGQKRNFSIDFYSDFRESWMSTNTGHRWKLSFDCREPAVKIQVRYKPYLNVRTKALFWYYTAKKAKPKLSRRICRSDYPPLWLCGAPDWWFSPSHFICSFWFYCNQFLKRRIANFYWEPSLHQALSWALNTDSIVLPLFFVRIHKVASEESVTQGSRVARPSAPGERRGWLCCGDSWAAMSSRCPVRPYWDSFKSDKNKDV